MDEVSGASSIQHQKIMTMTMRRGIRKSREEVRLNFRHTRINKGQYYDDEFPGL